MFKHREENREFMSEKEKERADDPKLEAKRREGVTADPHGADEFIHKPPYFVASIIVALFIFYLVAIYFAY